MWQESKNTRCSPMALQSFGRGRIDDSMKQRAADILTVDPGLLEYRWSYSARGLIVSCQRLPADPRVLHGLDRRVPTGDMEVALAGHQFRRGPMVSVPWCLSHGECLMLPHARV
jgi:hypothetical protein